MKISAINAYGALSSNKASLKSNKNIVNQHISLKEGASDSVSFQGNGGKIVGGLVGAAGGGLAGGAIIGGGTLAGMAALALTGPLGLGLVALYAVAGTAVGGYVGSAIGDAVEDKNDNVDGKKDNH